MKYHKPLSVHYLPVDPNPNRMSLHEAIMYCTFLEFEGKKGWRLPTSSEVDEIYALREATRCNSFIYKPKYVWTQDDLDNPSSHDPHNRGRVLAVRTKND
jgi:hypothetical protein